MPKLRRGSQQMCGSTHVGTAAAAAAAAVCSTNIHYILQNLGVKQLILAGCVTDQCVAHAVKDACDLGYLVTLVTGMVYRRDGRIGGGGLQPTLGTGGGQTHASRMLVLWSICHTLDRYC
jgi:hypothetical protein